MSDLEIELIWVDWKDYINMKPVSHKLVGTPAFYTINADTGRCIVWPTPTENVKMIAKVGIENE